MADVWREIRNGVDVVTGPRGLIIIDTQYKISSISPNAIKLPTYN